MTKTMPELLQERAALVEAMAALLNKAKAESRILTAEEDARYEALDGDITAKDAEIGVLEAALQKDQARAARVAVLVQDLNQPANPQRRPHIQVGANRAADKPWNHIGEFMQAVHAAAGPGVDPRDWDPRLKWQAAATGQGGVVPADGGFLIHSDMSMQLFEIGMAAAQLAPRCAPAPIGEGFDSTSIPAYDVTSLASGSLFGGITFYSGWQTQQAVKDSSTRTEKAVDKIVQSVVAIQLIAANEHGALQRAQDRTSCILTMTAERRDRFRDRYTPGAFRQECPWVNE